MPRILVVDDDANVRKLLLRYLVDMQYDVDEAPDGESALEQIDRCRPDMVLLDIVMPGIGGIEVLKTVHQLHPDLPVIMLSGLADEGLARETLKLGAFDFFLKPFDLATVEAHVSTKLEMMELEGEAATK